MSSEWYRNGIGMSSGAFWLPKFQGIVGLNFSFYFVGWKVEIRQMCYMILLVFVVDRVMSQNRILLTPEKLLTMKQYCSPPNNSDGIFPHRSPFVLRSFSVHPPFNLRSRSVRSPFILRWSSVQSPFELRSGIEERTENDRRIIGGKTEMYRLHIGIETKG